MTDRCENCGLDRWHSTADVGGCLPPDEESKCFGGRTCRLMASAYRRGRAEGAELAVGAIVEALKSVRSAANTPQNERIDQRIAALRLPPPPEVP